MVRVCGQEVETAMLVPAALLLCVMFMVTPVQVYTVQCTVHIVHNQAIHAAYVQCMKI